MGWFSNLFSSSTNNSNARRSMALTHDAFSLPTSSPIFSTHPDSFARDTPDPESRASQSYAYPPPSNSPTYDYVPTTSRSRPTTSLLPLHRDTPLSPLPHYPPLTQTWERLRTWLSNEYPELGDTLNYGILPQDLAAVELAFGFGLPSAVRESYLVVDGQEAESSAGCAEGLFFGLTLLPLDDVLEEWRFWREVDEDPATGANEQLKEIMQSVPPKWVRRVYSLRGWIPLITDKAGNYLGIDLNPDEGGSVGQVIVFGRDFDTKVVMWRGDGPAGWARWLAGFVEDLESGEGFELGNISEGSEDSEDGVGYESYFFDGSGRAKGEGGGDSGTAGLRLTGEYRGWNVLEAWADRSMRHWREAGLSKEEPSSPPKLNEKIEKEKQNHAVGVLDLVNASSGSAAEVPIPVVANSDSNLPDAPSQPSAPRSPVPIISVTKPPAPLPVDLPSPQDFEAMSAEGSRRTSSSSFESDLERGRGRHEPLSKDSMEMDEVEHPLTNADVASPTTPTPSAKQAPISMESEDPLVAVQSLGSAITAPRSEVDLLQTDSLEGVHVVPIDPIPTPSPVEPPKEIMPAPSEPVEESPAAPDEIVPPQPEQEPEKEPEQQLEQQPGPEPDHELEQDPDQTIRLVGGGGMSGTVLEPDVPAAVDGTNEPIPDPDMADVASVTSATSVTSNDSTSKATTGGKHDKKPSLTSRMKFGKFGGGKRKSEKEKEKDSSVAAH